MAVWDDAPGKPYHTVTFNKNDGTGLFEKRIARPEETSTEGVLLEAGGENIPDAENGETPDPVNEAYKIAAMYKIGAAEVYQDPLVPVFTRDHYTAKRWEDINETPVEVGNGSSYTFTQDTQLYQRWESKKFTLKFDLNGMTGVNNPGQISGVDEALSAAGGLAKAKQTLPTITGTPTKGEEDNAKLYVFSNWTDNKDGGNIVTAMTPLYPKEGESEVTLYAQWVEKGSKTDQFRYEGYVQTWTAPVTGTYTITAQGAGRGYDDGAGGRGGEISGEIELNEGTTLYIYVGGLGQPILGSTTQNYYRQAGGWNGGGRGGARTATSNLAIGGGGHGATDIRTVKASGVDTVWDDDTSLASRIMVAGGGGGSTSHGFAGNGGNGISAGGDGSNSKSDDNKVTSKGGAFAPQNAGQAYAGDKGKGGLGLDAHRGNAGGGGGYFGGEGGQDSQYQFICGGGGGSSWAKTDVSDGGTLYDSLKFSKILTEPAEGGGTHIGEGYVNINFMPAPKED